MKFVFDKKLWKDILFNLIVSFVGVIIFAIIGYISTYKFIFYVGSLGIVVIVWGFFLFNERDEDLKYKLRAIEMVKKVSKVSKDEFVDDNDSFFEDVNLINNVPLPKKFVEFDIDDDGIVSRSNSSPQCKLGSEFFVGDEINVKVPECVITLDSLKKFALSKKNEILDSINKKDLLNEKIVELDKKIVVLKKELNDLRVQAENLIN